MSMADVELTSCNNSTVDIMDQNMDEIENCCLLGVQRFKGLLVKRYHYLKQTYIMFAVQMVIPLILFSIVLLIDQFLRSSLYYDQPFELEYNNMYRNEEAMSYFQHNNETTFPEYYTKAANEYGIKVDELDLKQDFNRKILDKIQEIGTSDYVQRLLIGAGEEPIELGELVNDLTNISSRRKNFDVWYNNEVLHSLPISM